MKKVISLLFFLMGCSLPEDNAVDESSFSVRARRESVLFIEELGKEIPVKLQGLGGSFYGEQIHYVSMAMVLPAKVTLEEARDISVEIASRWLEWMNRDEFLKSFTKEDRFTFLHIRMILDFFYEEELASEQMAVVFATRKGVLYTKKGDIDVHEETWEEAVDLAKDLGGIWPTAVMPNSEAKNGEEEPNN